MRWNGAKFEFGLCRWGRRGENKEEATKWRRKNIIEEASHEAAFSARSDLYGYGGGNQTGRRGFDSDVVCGSVGFGTVGFSSDNRKASALISATSAAVEWLVACVVAVIHGCYHSWTGTRERNRIGCSWNENVVLIDDKCLNVSDIIPGRS